MLMAFVSVCSFLGDPLARPVSRTRSHHAIQVRRIFHHASRMTLAESASADAKKQLEVRALEIFMPALSSTMERGKIVQWLKNPGDRVNKGDAVMVVESDKADMDVESFEDGYLAAVLIQEGEECNVGETVALLAASEDQIENVKECSTGCIVSGSGSRHDGTTAVDTPVAPPPTSTPPASSKVATSDIDVDVEKPDFREVFMPALSSTMTEGKVVDWLKAEGDYVKIGEMVLVVESDKADMEVESFEEGYLAHISVQPGNSCPIGDAVGFLATSEAGIGKVKAWALAQSDTSKLAASNGVAVDSSGAIPPTSPASAEPTATSESRSSVAPEVLHTGRVIASPYARKIASELGVDLRTVAGSGPNGRIVESDVRDAMASGAAKTTPFKSTKVIVTPEAKKIAKKENVDLGTVTGTGNFGRITGEDVLRALGKVPASVAKALASSAETKATQTSAPKKEKIETQEGAVAMNAMQKAVVKNMNATLGVPVFRVSRSIRTDDLDALYKRVKAKGVSMSALLAKAVAQTLELHPLLNAAYADETILYRPEVNLGMAVSLPDGGLITPVLRDASNVDIYSLARSWRDLVKRAAGKKLSPEEYTTGTFFISNMGMFGVDSFDAILPPGAPAILAVSAAKPVVAMMDNGMIGMRKQMTVNITCDHRHIYGADAAKFLQDLADLIENKTMELLT